MTGIIINSTSIILIVCSLASANFPKLLWRSALPESGTISSRGFRQGNGFTVSHDNKRLWSVSDDGYMYIHDAWNGNILAEVPPPGEIDDVVFVQSKSSVVVQHAKRKWEVGIYVLIELLEDNTERSRVVCVDEYGRRLWQKEINGIIEGTPQFSSIADNILYFTSNTIINAGDDEVGTQNPAMKGTLYALNIDNLEVSLVAASDGYPFTSLSVDKTSTGSIELVYFADQWKFGYSKDDGILYQGSFDFSNKSDKNLPQITLSPLRVIDGTSVTRPVIFEDGTNFIVAAGGAKVNGVRIRSTGAYVNDYEIKLDRTDRNASAPIMASPVVTSDGKKAFVSTWDSKIYEINVIDEVIEETIRLNGESGDKYASFTVTSPLLSIDEEILYVMQSRKGELSAINTSDISSIEWSLNCHDFNENDDGFCEDSVEAEMAFSINGALLYYGTIYGEIFAIQVMDFPPTQAPTTMPPTLHSSFNPTLQSDIYPSNNITSRSYSIKSFSKIIFAITLIGSMYHLG